LVAVGFCASIAADATGFLSQDARRAGAKMARFDALETNVVTMHQVLDDCPTLQNAADLLPQTR
jgi:hypothetical protein